jgi:hypothetical protein
VNIGATRVEYRQNRFSPRAVTVRNLPVTRRNYTVATTAVNVCKPVFARQGSNIKKRLNHVNLFSIPGKHAELPVQMVKPLG